MASTFIGLDVGTNAVRAAEITGGDRPVLRGFGQVGLPPGAVHEGEVVDVAVVAQALRTLWKGAGFRSRTVRVGLASSRVIVRVVELPALSVAETTSALRLQLDQYVPLAPEDTVFDFQPLAGGAAGMQRVVFAATHRDAVRPLIDAIRDAGLKVGAVDVMPSALARALVGVEPHVDGTVDLIVSIGAGTVIVVAADAGVPVFARTITSVAGRHVTERIAAQLSVSDAHAERLKRWDGDDADEAIAAQGAARPAVAELVDEIADSVEFYLGQEDALSIRRAQVTGGGSLQPDLIEALSERLRIDVTVADPFIGLRVGDIGYDDSDLPFLAPYLPAAIGLALAGGGREKRLDLTPEVVRRNGEVGNRRLLVVAGTAVVLLSVGALYVRQRGAVSEERSKLAATEATLTEARAALVAASTERSGPHDVGDAARSIIESSEASDMDWLAVVQELDAIGGATVVLIDTVQGAVEAPVIVIEDEPAASDDPTPSADDGAEAAAETGPAGRLSVSGTAADATVVAEWLDAVRASARFEDAWVDNVTTLTTDDGVAQVEFSAQLVLTRTNGVVRALRGGAPA
jgi:type IV pilus assembly protein PilM